jgi:hypothetical protein
MNSHTVNSAARRILSAMFGGEPAGFTDAQAQKFQEADTPEWREAVRYAKAALTGIVPDSAL